VRFFFILLAIENTYFKKLFLRVQKIKNGDIFCYEEATNTSHFLCTGTFRDIEEAFIKTAINAGFWKPTRSFVREYKCENLIKASIAKCTSKV